MTAPTGTLGIAEVAARTGLSQDTLRWYEKEGLLPRVQRGSDRRRRYDHGAVRMTELIVRLRRTGMPVAEVRRFVEYLGEGASSHGRRRTLLADHRVRVLDQIARLHDDLAALDDKIAHYDDLVARGLDCDDQPIHDPRVRARQRATH